ncbi:GNAT family N-acetyltransferase [Streptomyces tsukubensis]|uniref:GNAT family N-acetyltransferase n=2 Tax=Streptomyces tsukubensis TaxID=83656 RepID=A0A1V4ABP0_9ACTN|nr:GNAT family N-acetyltransferase [Streptomyces tsukubensis]
MDALHTWGFGADAEASEGTVAPDGPMAPEDLTVAPVGWSARVRRHSLGWVCARRAGMLVGFVNVAWDGGDHAFLLDTVVAPPLWRTGLGTRLVDEARCGARAAGCEWLHVDFESRLTPFYLDRCGFGPTAAGLLRL